MQNSVSKTREMSLDIKKIRKDFPILNQKVYGKPFVYFDNSATTQKPLEVIDGIRNFYLHANSNIHRGVHFLSEKATAAYENARRVVKEFINAEHTHEVLFTKGTTESINLLAFSFGEKYINKGDEIILSAMEHHSNIVPWQLMCDRKGAKIKVIPMNDKGELLIEEYKKLITEKTKLVAVVHVSNSLGTVNPVKEITKIAHQAGVPVLIDGAQSVQHLNVDVQDIDCDFFAFSAHKIYASTGSGVLYGKEKWLNELPPYQGGGEMIKSVSFERTTYNELPYKFEAGTPDYVGAISLTRAIQYLNRIGIDKIAAYESELLDYAHEKLGSIENLKIYGEAAEKASIFAFLLKEIHHYDTGMIIDKMGIAVRTGTHCTEPVMQRFGIEGTVRASFAFYNTKEEIDRLYEAIIKVKQMFG